MNSLMCPLEVEIFCLFIYTFRFPEILYRDSEVCFKSFLFKYALILVIAKF